MGETDLYCNMPSLCAIKEVISVSSLFHSIVLTDAKNGKTTLKKISHYMVSVLEERVGKEYSTFQFK